MIMTWQSTSELSEIRSELDGLNDLRFAGLSEEADNLAQLRTEELFRQAKILKNGVDLTV